MFENGGECLQRWFERLGAPAHSHCERRLRHRHCRSRAFAYCARLRLIPAAGMGAARSRGAALAPCGLRAPTGGTIDGIAAGRRAMLDRERCRCIVRCETLSNSTFDCVSMWKNVKRSCAPRRQTPAAALATGTRTDMAHVRPGGTDLGEGTGVSWMHFRLNCAF